jgi:hypothetical protein
VVGIDGVVHDRKWVQWRTATTRSKEAGFQVFDPSGRDELSAVIEHELKLAFAVFTAINHYR